jgi:hypothetical protein
VSLCLQQTHGNHASNSSSENGRELTTGFSGSFSASLDLLFHHSLPHAGSSAFKKTSMNASMSTHVFSAMWMGQSYRFPAAICRFEQPGFVEMVIRRRGLDRLDAIVGY